MEVKERQTQKERQRNKEKKRREEEADKDRKLIYGYAENMYTERSTAGKKRGKYDTMLCFLVSNNEPAVMSEIRVKEIFRERF